MRAIVLLLVAACGHRDPRVIRACNDVANIPFAQNGELAIFAYPFPKPWPSGREHGVAIGTARYDVGRYQKCATGRVESVDLSSLVQATFDPPNLGSVISSELSFERLHITMDMREVGTGTLTFTVLTEDGDEVTDHVAVRTVKPTGLAITTSMTDGFAREPMLPGVEWSTGNAWPVGDGEPLAGQLADGWRAPGSLFELRYWSEDSQEGRVRFDTLGTGAIYLLPTGLGVPPPESVAPTPIEVLGPAQVTSATMTSTTGMSCFVNQGGNANVTLKDAANRTVHGGAFTVTSSAPTVVSASAASPETVSFLCKSSGTATLSTALPNASASVTLTVQ